jgi:hypothetical protein
VLILQGRVGETLTIKRQAVNELEETESLARQAVSYAYETDFGWAHALVHERSLTSSRPRNAPTRHGKSSAARSRSTRATAIRSRQVAREP